MDAVIKGILQVWSIRVKSAAFFTFTMRHLFLNVKCHFQNATGE